MRLFIAILLDENIKRALTDAQEGLRRNEYLGRYTDGRNLHITLSFIGEYPDADYVIDVMEGVAFQPISLSLSGYIGNFGNLLWAGTEPNAKLEQYVKQLRHTLSDAQIPFDKKKFHPHITLLRNAQSRHSFTDINVRKEAMEVQRIFLMRSDFGKHGAVYTEIGAVNAKKRL